jgi:hypothetical protein
MADARPLHGVRWNTDGSGTLLFGIHRLFARIENSFRPTQANPQTGSELWPDVWIDPLFLKAHYKFHRTLHDALHAAARLGETIRSAEGLRDEGRPEHMDLLSTVTKDATLYLDALLVYFKLQADCLAMIVPNLYGRNGQQIKGKARGNFREQRKWFMKRPTFDPTYLTCLKECTGWFDRLSGDDTGWRDDVVHRFGTYNISAVIGDEAVSLHVELGRPAHAPYTNLLGDLRDAIGDYCCFLDRITDHFAEHVNAQLTTPLFDVSNETQWGCRFIDGGSPGIWLLPPIAGH